MKQRVNCNTCGKSLLRSPSKVEPRNYCSRECYTLVRNRELAKRGKPYRIKKGRKEIPGRIEAVRKITNEVHYAWKGGEVSYRGLHAWIRRKKGHPTQCSKCGKQSKNKRIIQWANIDGMYRRVLEDFIPLCVSCHKYHDQKIKSIRGARSANQ